MESFKNIFEWSNTMLKRGYKPGEDSKGPYYMDKLGFKHRYKENNRNIASNTNADSNDTYFLKNNNIVSSTNWENYTHNKGTSYTERQLPEDIEPIGKHNRKYVNPVTINSFATSSIPLVVEEQKRIVINTTTDVPHLYASINQFQSNFQDEKKERVETHFIDEKYGKYLGESDQYYDYITNDSVVTFTDLKINIRTIPKEDWNTIKKNFSKISDPLTFDKQKVVDDFKYIVDKGKNALDEDKNVEQSLVVIHNFEKKELTSVVLPDYVNTNESVRVVKALIKTSDDGNWLVPNVPSGNWDEAIKYPEDNRFYEQARTAQLIVIGFSHTHPEIYNSAVRQSKSTITAHSEDDMRLYKKTKLPDIIISISVDAKWNSKFVKLELLSDYRYKKLPDLNEFLIKIENSIFNFIIKEYNHKII